MKSVSEQIDLQVRYKAYTSMITTSHSHVHQKLIRHQIGVQIRDQVNNRVWHQVRDQVESKMQ
jgi:hypothetical protein